MITNAMCVIMRLDSEKIRIQYKLLYFVNWTFRVKEKSKVLPLTGL